MHPHQGAPTPVMTDEMRLALMRQGKTYQFEIGIGELRVKVRPLSQDETLRIADDVARELEKIPLEQRLRLRESSMIVYRTLEAASTIIAGVPALPATLLSKMTPDELDYLYRQYVAVMERVNPSLDLMSREEVEALVEQVKKNPEPRSALTALSLRELASICAHSILTS